MDGYLIDAIAGIVFGKKGSPIRRVNGRGYVEVHKGSKAMNKQDRREFITVVTNDQIAERIIGMSFGEKREAWIDWSILVGRVGLAVMPFREWLFDRVEQKILAERDASYHEAGEPL